MNKTGSAATVSLYIGLTGANTAGTDSAIITYQLQLDNTVVAGSSGYSIFANVQNYGALNAATLNHGPANYTWSNLTIAQPLLAVTELTTTETVRPSRMARTPRLPAALTASSNSSSITA